MKPSMRPPPIYLDHAAPTPVDKRVLEAMLPYFGARFGNPGSRAYGRGLDAEAAVEEARRQVASLIGARPVEITFTGGATESNNLALLGLVGSWGASRARLIVSAIEHPAVLETARHLESQGAELHLLPVDQNARVRLEALEELLQEDTERQTLVSVMHANNETGTVQPVAEVGRLCRRGAIFHCDASQSVGKIAVDVGEMGADLLSLSAHKCYGPMGVGALYVRRRRPRLPIRPLFHGGGQERGLRPGTLNLPGVVGLGAAAELASQLLESESERLRKLSDRLLGSLRRGGGLHQGGLHQGGVQLNGCTRHRLPGTLNLSFEGIPAERLQQAVKDRLEISTGSACSTGKVGPSHVIRALGLPEARAAGALRLALGRSTSEQDVEDTAQILVSAVTELRRAACSGA